jgi:hypothetical protein
MHEKLEIFDKRKIPEPKKEIEHKKYQWENKAKQKAKPEFVQSGRFIINWAHNIRISIFA